ncbi:hypothetical protein ACIQZI_08950 [Peribacillus sp. NPDC096379]|uniref:hypothetical protein n=1 Tax=Peribacillus sp. NPDC096379 TaxID=3364393 RepID=UPI00381DA73A
MKSKSLRLIKKTLHEHYLVLQQSGAFMTFYDLGLDNASLHSVGSCSICGSRHTERAEELKVKEIKTKGMQPSGCLLFYFILFFPFAFRIVKQRKLSNLSAGRTPEPYRLKAKKPSQSVKGHKTFLLKTLRSIKKFCAQTALDPLPIRVFRSTCKRGKNNPPLGNKLRFERQKEKINPKIYERKNN